MFTVYTYDDATFDGMVVFTGSLDACKTFIANDDFADDLYIVAPDGFTVVG